MDTEVHRFALEIMIDDTVRFLGYPEDHPVPEKTLERLKPILVEARRLASAEGLFEVHPVERAGEIGLKPIAADSLAVGLVTAGVEIEERAGELCREGDVRGCLLMDAAGSAAAEEAADRLGAIIAGCEDTDGGKPVSCRISPGYGDWPLGSQKAIFNMLPHVRAGIVLLPSMMMLPRKSISFAMWLGAEGVPAQGLSGCSSCRFERCRYRRPGTNASGGNGTP